MKKNFIPTLLLSVLPLSISAIPSVNLNQPITSDVLMCEALASIEINPKPAVISVIPTTATFPVAPSDFDVFFETYANQYGISSATLKIIANCESRLNPAALSKSGTYGGLFQYSAATWASTRRSMGLDENPELRFNAEEAIRTTAYKIANGGIGAWPHCGKKVSLK